MNLEKLVSEVLVRVPLWNKAHPDHHNRYVLIRLWNEVAEELGCKRDAVQKKWKSMRDYFRMECSKRIRQSGDPAILESTSSWPHYESMKFLLDQMSNTRSCSELSNSDVSPAAGKSPGILEQETSSEQVDEEEFSQNNHKFSEALSAASEETITGEPLRRRKRKSQLEIIGSALIDLQRRKLRSLNSINSGKSVESNSDEDRSFFESLIPHVKMIQPDQKLLFRNEIQLVVQRFAYSKLSSATSEG